MKEKTGVLFSGGKDSCLALHKYGAGKVDVLLSILPSNFDSWMFHKADKKLLEKQAENLGLKIIFEETAGEKEKELEDLKKLLVKSGIKKLVIGGIKSNYQGDRIKKLCKNLGIEVVAPLWGYSEEKLWIELLDSKFKVILTKISCEGINKSFLGKVIERKELEELIKLQKKYKFRLDFEGGEAESAVLFMPEFENEIKIEFDVESDGKYRHFIKIIKVE